MSNSSLLLSIYIESFSSVSFSSNSTASVCRFPPPGYPYLAARVAALEGVDTATVDLVATALPHRLTEDTPGRGTPCTFVIVHK